ncbi:MFS transporter [Limibacillus halophilus]|uniref:MFS family permease n=1 Tax=Limibacillus halophilus TaxID=1579333 RepID=A0A839SRX7_9PROT|nr:MFS transporter [Limibacillus halophilus]MBB3064729.1 MFS family permease [Limibacillus halophilus]
MEPTVRPLGVLSRAWNFAPLLFSAGILLGGNGLFGTLVAVRANLEGFGPSFVGYVGTAYFIGFGAGCLFVPWLIRRAGHIRVFAAFCALCAIGALLMVLVIHPVVWLVVRMIMGICFSGLLSIVESWLNAQSERGDRGRILSIYRIVDLLFVTSGQFVLPWVGAVGFDIFAVVAMIYCLSLLPLTLSRQKTPPVPTSATLNIRRSYMISPLASIGCVTIGLTNSAFRMVGPLYAQEMGLAVAQVATFMSLGIVGGAVTQYPLGWLSDRMNRRGVLMLTTGLAALSGLYMTVFADSSEMALMVGAFMFGAFSSPLYSLSVAHANDFAEPEDFIDLSATLMLFYSAGAIVGPTLAAWVLEVAAPSYFFLYMTVLHGSLILFIIYRMGRRATVPMSAKKRFVGLLRTSPMLMRWATGHTAPGAAQTESVSSSQASGR